MVHWQWYDEMLCWGADTLHSTGPGCPTVCMPAFGSPWPSGQVLSIEPLPVSQSPFRGWEGLDYFAASTGGG
jgi:hypothetical protein